MANKYISSVHIEKLGHKLLEIRERALFNLLSKLDNGLIYDNDLARSKELLNKLFNWFLFEPCSQEEVIFNLIKRTLQSESGKTLINHYGKDMLQGELRQIKSYIEPRFFKNIDDLIECINCINEIPVPPLISDVPLSYRSSDTVSGRFKTVETTATLQEGYVHKDDSLDQQQGASSGKLDTYTIRSNRETYRVPNENSIFSNFLLDWQPLVPPDQHILNSIEESLSNPPQPATLLHSCEFFVDVLLHDFPAEVFIQRPNIIYNFFNLLEVSPSTRVVNGVLNCLLCTTKALQVRLSQCNDVSMKNSKLQVIYESDTNEINGITEYNRASSRSSRASSRGSDKYELPEDVLLLKQMQLTIPRFCYLTVKKVLKFFCVKPENLQSDRCKPTKQVGFNLAVKLVEEVFKLLSSSIKSVNTVDSNGDMKSDDLKKDFNDLLYVYGETLEFYRLESISTENNVNCRVLYLYILHNCVILLKLLSSSTINVLIPPNFKASLAKSLLDVCLDRIYPKVHEELLHYVESYNLEDEDHLQKYRLIKKVCNGMQSTVKIITKNKSLNFSDFLMMTQDALHCLEFHKNLSLVRIFVEVVAEKLPLFNSEDIISIAKDVTLKMLAHNVEEIREEMYRVCHSKVISTVGPNIPAMRSHDVGSPILFLLSSKIITEIAVFGIGSENSKISLYAENIINHIIKCKLLVSENIWNKTVNVLVSSFPILCCFAEKDSLIGRIIVNILDPDTAYDLLIPKITTLKSNTALLFSKNPNSREEAFSRVCWLLATQENAKDLLPRMNNLYDKGLARICQNPKLLDINKIRVTEHFYQPSSLYQVMDVLKATSIEPVIRRSALTQVSVMLEDPLLHQVFIDIGGVKIIVDRMQSALKEKDYQDYPDSIIPAITILKHLALYYSNVRETLGTNIDVIICLLRGMFMFFTEDRVKQDGSLLLFLLLYKDYIIGAPNTANFSVPSFIYENLNVPFTCGTHWGYSQYAEESIRDLILKDQWCLRSLQIQWNIEVFGFQTLLKSCSISYEDAKITVPDMLKINNYDLQCLKYSSVDYCIEKSLNSVQTGAEHLGVIESMNNLILYINLHKVNKYLNPSTKIDDILSHPWEKTLKKFLKVLPSSAEDVLLLKTVLKLLQVLAPCYKNCEKGCWITNFLKTPTNYVLDLLSIDNTADEELKILSEELQKLISLCVCQEQHYLDYYTGSNEAENEEDSKRKWGHVINILADSLKFSDGQHFYNLAYLDSILSCLVHLTASLGWSNKNSSPKPPIPQMLKVLCELVIAFHCGKGPSAAVSVMGLSITRHVLLILNHLLAELQYSRTKGWEICFLDNLDEINIFQSFIALLSSRDVLLRAAALQLFNGLILNSRIAVEVVRSVVVDNGGIWELAFSVSVDNGEANIVRENALLLLANLLSHAVLVPNEKRGILANSLKRDNVSYINTLIEEFDFFAQLEVLLNKLFTLRMPEKSGKLLCADSEESMILSSKSSSSKSNVDEVTVNSSLATPSLVKNLAIVLTNMLALNPTEICNKLHDQGILKLLFKTLCLPAISISHTKELSLYCDLLEMNAYVCLCLCKAATCNSTCLGTILYTRDCFNVLMTLLNPKIYHTSLPQLAYLRNRLWTEIFNLISTLITESERSSLESLSVISDTITEVGPEPFLETLCESLSSIGANNLQTASLSLIISLLRVECMITPNSKDHSVSSYSMQDLLDTIKTPRSFLSIEDNENEENIVPNHQFKSQNIFDANPAKRSNYVMNLLEDTYFGNTTQKMSKADMIHDKITYYTDNSQNLMAGAEICKILLFLYDMEEVQSKKVATGSKRKLSVINALSSVLCISEEAKKYALSKNTLLNIITKLKQFVITLSLNSVDCLRKLADKKRICPILKELNETIGLLTNFMYKFDEVKYEAAKYDIANLIHKLWVWFSVQSSYLVDVLRLLCTFTTNCSLACQSLPLTSAIVGSGPKKSPSNICLLYVIVQLIEKEMNQVSKTHNLTVLELSFSILHNCCSVLECRVFLSKGNLLQSVSRLHPAITKRQKPWYNIEMIWLNFLETFTKYPEGQTCIAKISDVLEIIIILTNSPKGDIRKLAMSVLRNLAFYQPNRLRLLASGDFLSTLQTKLDNDDKQEKNIAVVIIWTLAANSQKAKLVLKSAQLDHKLEKAIKHEKIVGELDTQDEDVQRMFYVLNILRDAEKVR